MVSMVDRFCGHLERAERIPLTLRVYRSDLEGLAKRFEEQTGGPFSPAKITPTDLRDYKMAHRPGSEASDLWVRSTETVHACSDPARRHVPLSADRKPEALSARVAGTPTRNTLQLSSMSAICGTSPDKLVSNDTVEAGAVKRKASVRTHSDAYDFERALKKLVRPFERAVVKDGSRFRPTEP